MTTLRVLFLTTPHQDYLADSLMHGLRRLLGADLVDFPKADFLYESYPESARGELYGRGFSLYCLLPDIALERRRALDRAREGEFDLVVFADIWNNFGRFVELAPSLTRDRLAVIDGADREEPYPYAGAFWRKRVWWTLPRAHVRATYFKRELTPLTGWFRSFLLLPPVIATKLPSIRSMHEIAFSFPAEKIVTRAPLEKRAQFASHVVDPEVASRLGRDTRYAFSEESDYYEDLRAARYGITVKRAGWDCLRHYELAANGCVPCFRDLKRKPARCAPHGLNESNCVSYENYDDLVRKLKHIDEARYRSLQDGALKWARDNSTVRRAERFLTDCGFALSQSRPMGLDAGRRRDVA